MAISQEDMNEERHLTGDMQRAGCRTVVFYQQNKGSVWLNLLNWSEPQKKNNDYYDMVLGALLWLNPIENRNKADVYGAGWVDLSQKWVAFLNKSWVSCFDQHK